jgi:Bacteriophage HK97-gp10, putative tail-component
MNETITIQGYADLQARFKRLGQVDKPLLKMLGTAGVREAEARVPRKTGNLWRSISSQVEGSFSVRLTAHANYAADVEHGTKPHIIKPRNGGVLAWPASAAGRRLSGSARSGMFKGKVSAAKLGGWAYARVVHHPGTKPHPYLLPGAKAAIEGSGLAKEIVAVWNGKTV